MKTHALLAQLLLAVTCLQSAQAEPADNRPDWPGAGQLFVGTNYQPYDRTREQIERDIARMKDAGMKVVRFGDLAWDAFEPQEGRFDFALTDWIMDRGRRVLQRVFAITYS
jgi:beta-galactosidase